LDSGIRKSEFSYLRIADLGLERSEGARDNAVLDLGTNAVLDLGTMQHQIAKGTASK
jgi:hypothetical protein